MRNASHPLNEWVGTRLRIARHTNLITQDHIARAAQALGLGWGRSSVAQLEQGRRRISAEELLMLPGIMAIACEVAGVGLVAGGTLDEYLSPGRARLALTDGLALTAAEVAALLGASEASLAPFQKAARRALADASIETELERRLAAQHGLEVSEIDETARVLWGQSLYEERERRLDATGDTRSDQAARGHVTRTLVAEIKAHLEGD